jgi:predicted nucleic acid-binding protein
MGLIVVDASAIVEMMAPDDASRCAAVTARLSLGDAAYAPAHLDLEVAAAIRGIFRRKTNPAEAAPALLRDFYDQAGAAFVRGVSAGLALARQHDRV